MVGRRTALWAIAGIAILPPGRTEAYLSQSHDVRSNNGLGCRLSSRFSSNEPDSSSSTIDDDGSGSATQLTDWVVENLESAESSITSTSSVKAGENDTIPTSGLCIGKVRILPAGTTYHVTNNDNDHLYPIRLLVGRNGWGTGVHPTTRLCLEWVCDTVQGGEVLLDYGCGSGILSIAALHSGAARCIGVDVEAEALVSAERNVQLNGYGDARFEGLHTREVIPYGLCTPTGVDVCVANILIGQLVRPSMVAALVSNMVPGALLCLSGIRPDEVNSLKAVYGEHMKWLDDEYAELSACDTEGSFESYGFDCGRWARLVGRKKVGPGKDHDIENMSELAVS
jgi:ribosomal protein L11 methyltransferase